MPVPLNPLILCINRHSEEVIEVVVVSVVMEDVVKVEENLHVMILSLNLSRESLQINLSNSKARSLSHVGSVEVNFHTLENALLKALPVISVVFKIILQKSVAQLLNRQNPNLHTSLFTMFRMTSLQLIVNIALAMM